MTISPNPHAARPETACAMTISPNPHAARPETACAMYQGGRVGAGRREGHDERVEELPVGEQLRERELRHAQLPQVRADKVGHARHMEAVWQQRIRHRQRGAVRKQRLCIVHHGRLHERQRRRRLRRWRAGSW